VIFRLPILILALALASGCSTTRSGKDGWTGPEPLTSQMRQQCFDVWTAELRERSPDGPVPRPLSEFERLRVRVSTGVERLPNANQVAITKGAAGSPVSEILFRSPNPRWEQEGRHEAFHPYLFYHGVEGHPPLFGKRHGIWNWRDK